MTSVDISVEVYAVGPHHGHHHHHDGGHGEDQLHQLQGPQGEGRPVEALDTGYNVTLKSKTGCLIKVPVCCTVQFSTAHYSTARPVGML